MAARHVLLYQTIAAVQCCEYKIYVLQVTLDSDWLERFMRLVPGTYLHLAAHAAVQ